VVEYWSVGVMGGDEEKLTAEYLARQSRNQSG